MTGDEPHVTDEAYARLAHLRSGIRSYLAWAEEQARAFDTTPMQFQLALAIRSSGIPGGPTVRELADMLHLRHHSVVGLIDRTEAAGLVRRDRDAVNGTLVRVSLTTAGERLLERLAARHLAHLTTIAPQMGDAWRSFTDGDTDAMPPGAAPVPATKEGLCPTPTPNPAPPR